MFLELNRVGNDGRSEPMPINMDRIAMFVVATGGSVLFEDLFCGGGSFHVDETPREIQDMLNEVRMDAFTG